MSKSDGHYLITRFYNPYLNTFISRYSNDEIIGTSKAGNFDIAIRRNKYPNLIHYANLLRNLRDEIVAIKDDKFKGQLNKLVGVYQKVNHDLYSLNSDELEVIQQELIPQLESLFKELDVVYSINLLHQAHKNSVSKSHKSKTIRNTFEVGYNEDIHKSLQYTEKLTNSPPKVEEKYKREKITNNDTKRCPECTSIYNRLFITAEFICPYCKNHYCEKHASIQMHNCNATPHSNSKNDDLKIDSHTTKSTKNLNLDKYANLNLLSMKLRTVNYNFNYVLLVSMIISYFLASKTGFGVLFDWISFASGAVLILILFLKSLKWANRVNLSSDLNYFGLKILAFFVIFAISFMYITQIQVTISNKSAGLYVESLVWLVMIALFILALFIGVRTNRREKMIGIWQ